MPPIRRRKSVTCTIGAIRVGSDAPVVVQSMTNTDTADVASTVEQVASLARAGSELVRVTVNNEDAAAAVPHIVEQLDKRGIHVPIIGDFHYNGHILLKKYPACARALAKYRINPGNVSVGRKDDSNFGTMVKVAVENQKPVRIGVNWGSLDQSLLTRMMSGPHRSRHGRQRNRRFKRRARNSSPRRHRRYYSCFADSRTWRRPRRRSPRRSTNFAVARNSQLHSTSHRLPWLRTNYQHLLPGNG